MKPFGCPSFIRIHDINRKKMDPKAMPCILVGICLLKSRNAIFDEGVPIIDTDNDLENLIPVIQIDRIMKTNL